MCVGWITKRRYVCLEIYIYVMVGFVVLSVAGFGCVSCFWVLGMEQAGVTDGVR